MYGANKAADAQTNAANASIANQRQMYAQNKDVLSPFIQGGQNQIASQQALLDPNNASGPLAQLLKLTMPGADMSATLEQTPGYQFAQGQGLRAVNNQLAARGLAGSGGPVAKGAAAFTTGLAQNTWQNVVQALANTYQTQLSGGQNLINTGAQSGNALAGVGTNTANAISGAQTGAGNAQAAAANATGSAIGNAANAFPSSLMLGQLTGGGIYGNVGGMPATGAGAPGDMQSNLYAMSQGINPWG
jgi:hypothetical protein